MLDQTVEFGHRESADLWTPWRRSLRDWFRKNAESLAPAYEGAVDLLGRPTFPGRLHFIAHAVRDISNVLVYALEPQPKCARVEYVNEMDCIAKEWKSPDGSFQDAGSGLPPRDIIISAKLAKLIDRLVVAHRESRERPKPHELLIRFLVSRSLSPPASIDGLVREFGGIAKWFMHHTHLSDKPLPSVGEEELQRNFRAFEGAILGMVGNFFAGAEAIDEILERANG